MTRHLKPGLVSAALAVCAAPALAHTGGDLGGFASGLLHPLTGLDHVVAMVAVGLWGGILGKPALWLLPIVFPLMMAVAGAFGAAGFPLPGVETGIAVSGIVLGALVLLEQKASLAAALPVVAFFAIFHGYAHGAELPASANPTVYALGFVLATGFLHLCGIALGQIGTFPAGRWVVRAAGAGIALAGGAFLTGLA